MNGLGKINTAQIKYQVYERCRDLIINGTWEPGSKLPSEGQLCDRFGVSRVSVRSALQSLEAQGFIEIKRGEGSFVRQHSLSDQLNLLIPVFALGEADVMEVLEYRQIVEPSIMPIIVEKATENDIAALHNNYRKMQESLDDIPLFARYDEQFHIELVEIISNRIVEKIYRVLFEVFSSSWYEICEVLGTGDGVNYHKALIEAIEQRDSDKAVKLMREHVERTQVRMRDYYKSQQADSP